MTQFDENKEEKNTGKIPLPSDEKSLTEEEKIDSDPFFYREDPADTDGEDKLYNHKNADKDDIRSK